MAVLRLSSLLDLLIGPACSQLLVVTWRRSMVTSGCEAGLPRQPLAFPCQPNKQSGTASSPSHLPTWFRPSNTLAETRLDSARITFFSTAFDLIVVNAPRHQSVLFPKNCRRRGWSANLHQPRLISDLIAFQHLPRFIRTRNGARYF